MPIVLRLPDGRTVEIEPHGALDTMLYIHGILPIRRDHGHIDPSVYHDLYDRAAGTITTYCSICGEFLGRRPIEKPKRRKTR